MTKMAKLSGRSHNFRLTTQVLMFTILSLTVISSNSDYSGDFGTPYSKLVHTKPAGRAPRDLGDDFIKEFWSIPNKDMPHKFDARNFESPTVASCANSAYRDGEKLAVWRAGRCWYKSVKEDTSSIMNQNGLLLGKYDVPLSDIDSPVDIETAKNWAKTKKCDMIIANEGYQEFWCKKYVDTPGATMLFRFEDMQNEPPITATRSGDGNYLAKFWPITDKDMPHKLDKHHFESPQISSCARSAYNDGEELAVWRANRCYYKNVSSNNMITLNRYGQEVGRYDVPSSDIESPARSEIGNKWMRTGKCDMIIVNSNWTEYWCKKYVDSPATVMLFLKNYSPPSSSAGTPSQTD